jgi:hypothetical protein
MKFTTRDLKSLIHEVVVDMNWEDSVDKKKVEAFFIRNKSAEYVMIDFLNIYILDSANQLKLTYNGESTHTIEKNIDPLLKSLKLPTVERLKELYPTYTEFGNVTTEWDIIFNV